MSSIPTNRGRASVTPLAFAGVTAFVALTFLITNRAPAQTADNPKSLTPAQTADAATPSPATLKLFDDIDDIDKLRILNPLKLTTDQMDKLADMVTTAKAVYDKKVAAIATAPIVQIADEIRSTKKSVLAGGEIPTAFDDKVKKIQDDFTKQREEINVANFKSLIDRSRAILTEEQVNTAIKLEKKTKPADVTVTTPDDRWFNLYVLDVFINYPRIVPLLKEMKTAHPS